MYIPVSYWQTQGASNARMAGVFFTPAVPTNISYTYDGKSFITQCTLANQIAKVCMDVTSEDSLIKTGVSVAGATYFCSAAVSGTININTPPNTGPEAWYIDVSYGPSATDVDLYYYNYIDINGNIINDTISFGQTKRIITQANPLFLRTTTGTFNFYPEWNIVEKFNGQVIPFPYQNVPCDYTLQLKRSDVQTGNFVMPRITSSPVVINNGFPVMTFSGSFRDQAASSLNATIIISSSNPPIDYNLNNNVGGGSIWITNVTPKTKGALLLSSCTSTHSLWVTLNDYNFYPTGSVLKVTNTELTTTGSCWTVSSISSSLSVPISFTNTNISQSYSEGECPICLGQEPIQATGGVTGSFVESGSVYKFHRFTSNGTFTMVSGSTNNARVMVVAGGGGGGARGGGGAGGVIYTSSVQLIAPPSGVVENFGIVIGTGGAAYNGTAFNTSAKNGTNTTVTGPSNFVAIGGGRGGQFSGVGQELAPGNGGSGGGASGLTGGSIGLGTSGQGNNGGGGSLSGDAGGGGGGANAAGSLANGGDGRQLGTLMFGSSSFYGGGGAATIGGSFGTPGTGSVNQGGGGRGGGGSTPGIVGKAGIVVITYPLYG